MTIPISGTSAVDGHRKSPAPLEIPKKSRYPPKMPTEALVVVSASRRATDGTPLVPVDRISVSISARPAVSNTGAPVCLNIPTGSSGILRRSVTSTMSAGPTPAASQWAR